MQRTEKILVLTLLLLIFLTRLYHINTPPWEFEESWRQADTESMAWNFVNYDFDLWRPNLNYDGPFPNIPALEFPVTTGLIALLYGIFGRQYFWARLVPIIFFLLSSLYLYLFARLHLGVRAALLGLACYGILPIFLYYSRAIMPETAALMFMNGGLYYFNLYLLRTKEKRQIFIGRRNREAPLLISGLFLTLGIMTKPPVIFVGLPMFYLCFKELGLSWLSRKKIWLYALLTLALPLVYYLYSGSLADYKFTLGISRDLVLKKALTAFYSPEALEFYFTNIPKTIGLSSFILLFPAILTLGKKERVILVWFLAMLLEVALIVSPIRATYYLIFWAVPCALLLGILLERILAGKRGKVLAMVLLLIVALESYIWVKPMYSVNEVMVTQVKVVQQLTTEEDLLVVGSFDPCLLSLSDRRGWRYNLGLYPDIPEDPYQELNYYIAKGAKYFVPIQGNIYGDEDGELLAYIESQYPKIEPVAGYPVYLLK